MKIEVSAEAKRDLREARKWYNQQQKGLGNRFATEVNEVLEDICRNPWFASVRFENVRTPFLKNFPYSVHYEIDEGSQLIRVAAIFHSSKKPFWLPDISDAPDDL
jgi:plasmid stabilization system protein ParE